MDVSSKGEAMVESLMVVSAELVNNLLHLNLSRIDKFQKDL